MIRIVLLAIDAADVAENATRSAIAAERIMIRSVVARMLILVAIDKLLFPDVFDVGLSVLSNSRRPLCGCILHGQQPNRDRREKREAHESAKTMN